MEASTETRPETAHAETATADNLYRFSGYVHVGPDAEECPGREDGSCTDPKHFHGWCRLPNQFERTSLLEKSSAAKARKLRALRDPESDSRVILESELESLRIGDNREELIGEIVNKDFITNHLEATTRVAEEAEEGFFDHIDDDKERLRALEEMPEEECPTEELEQLRKHISEHTTRVNAAREAIEGPRTDSLEGMSTDELIDIVRENRMEHVSFQEQNAAYGKWQWYICTFKPKPADQGFPNERVWGSIDQFTKDAPEVIRAVVDVIQNLEGESNATLKGS